MSFQTIQPISRFLRSSLNGIVTEVQMSEPRVILEALLTTCQLKQILIK